MLLHKTIVAVLTMLIGATSATAQVRYQSSATVVPDGPSTSSIIELQPDSVALPEYIPAEYDTVIVIAPLSQAMFMEPIYTHYRLFDEKNPFASEFSDNPYMEWIDRSAAITDREARIWQRFIIAHPELVHKNIAFMEKPPREYYAEVDPKEHTIAIKEVPIVTPEKIETTIEKRHWVRSFSASLQFSQAYISPNWYQGGNNNLNMLANIYYNVKLNPVYHPNLLFENTFQYKLGMNSAPDDSLRNYAISEDLLQVNTTFGIKAARHWYYSFTGQFKTQILNSYVKNTRNLKSAFLSPGELTAGLGMTYNYANAAKTVTFDASIAPLSYNLKICTVSNERLAHSTWNIEPDKSTYSTIGSSAEAKFGWQISRNINFRSRFFVFTDYSQIQADWENTLAMDINRYLSTQIYVHARYDSTTPRTEDPSWHKLQVKEILSFGVIYKFSSI